MLKTNGVYLALIICFNSLTFMNFLHLNKHQPHTVGGSNYKTMLVSVNHPKSSAFFFFIYISKMAAFSRIFSIWDFVVVVVTMRSASDAFS